MPPINRGATKGCCDCSPAGERVALTDGATEIVIEIVIEIVMTSPRAMANWLYSA
jgi:hypothetical protein